MKKYLWQVLSVGLSIVAIIAAYNIYYLGRPAKELQITIEAIAPLVNVLPEAQNNIQVMYKGALVTNVYLLQISIQNIGNQPILASDFTQPVSISLKPSDQIIDSSIIISEPTNIGMTLSQPNTNQIVTSPVLLNPTDAVTINLIVIKNGSDPLDTNMKVDGRIVGVKKIAVITNNNNQLASDTFPRWYDAVALSALVAAIVNIMAAYFSVRAKKRHQELENRNRTSTSEHN